MNRHLILRIHGPAGPARLVRPVLEHLGCSIVDAVEPVFADSADFWILADDVAEAREQVRTLCLPPARGLNSFDLVLAARQTGLELTLPRSRNHVVLQKPFNRTSFFRAVSGRRNVPFDGSAHVRIVFILGNDTRWTEAICGSSETDGIRSLAIASESDLLALLKLFSPDLVLVDTALLSLPVLEWIKELRTFVIEPALVVVLRDEGKDSVIDLRNAGADDVLTLTGSTTSARIRSTVSGLLEQRTRHEHNYLLSQEVAAKQVELQRINENLVTINRAVTEANGRLERQKHLKDEMVGMAAHELKSPLAAISGAVDILCQDPGRFDGGDAELLMLIQRNCRRMTKLVNDLLDLARLEAGRIAIRRQPVSIGALLENAIGAVNWRAREKNIRFDFAQAPTAREISVDESHVVQILVNLLDNAVKYSPIGTIVRLFVSMTRREVFFVVADAGPGIPEAERNRIFNRFYRLARSSDPNAAGSGLGLTITKALVELHGGSISVGEAVFGGAQFTVTLPLDSTPMPAP